MSTRADLAAALNGTGLVTVTGNYRPSIKAGQGFIKWAGRFRGDDGLGFLDTWQAWIALTKDVGHAEEWLETNLTALINALDTEAVVTNAEPAELVLGANVINGLILEAVAGPSA